MIKGVIFDMDGVLVDARELHYESLNKALVSIDSKYVITREEHLTIYDGLPTKKKLGMLTKDKGLPAESHQAVYDLKQKYTIEIITSTFGTDDRLVEVLKKLKQDGLSIYVASNSIRETIKMMLLKKGLLEYVDFFLSNEDVACSKPHPEIYLKTMIQAGLKPKECLIVEDSFHGRQAATDSGGHLLAVENTHQVTYDKINSEIQTINQKGLKLKWDGTKDFVVLLPMAGAGSRFKNAGFSFPKPLIEVNHKPMIQVVAENLGIKAKFVYIVQKSHYEQYNLKYLLNLISPGCDIVQVDGLTEGAACTTLLAKEYIDNDKHLLIANSDQFMEWDPIKFYYSMIADNIDGGILTFESTHPKWSFVKVDDNGYVTELAEKKPISNIATTGVYYWSKGSDYVKYAEQMIQKDIRVNGEYYTAPVYNEAIADGNKIKIFNIDRMWGIGVPEDLSYFLQNYKG